MCGCMHYILLARQAGVALQSALGACARKPELLACKRYVLARLRGVSRQRIIIQIQCIKTSTMYRECSVPVCRASCRSRHHADICSAHAPPVHRMTQAYIVVAIALLCACSSCTIYPEGIVSRKPVNTPRHGLVMVTPTNTASTADTEILLALVQQIAARTNSSMQNVVGRLKMGTSVTPIKQTNWNGNGQIPQQQCGPTEHPDQGCFSLLNVRKPAQPHQFSTGP